MYINCEYCGKLFGINEHTPTAEIYHSTIHAKFCSRQCQQSFIQQQEQMKANNWMQWKMQKEDWKTGIH